MTIDPEADFDELVSSALALQPRPTDQAFVGAVTLAIAEEQRFRDVCRTFVGRTLLDAATLLTLGGMFAILLQAGPLKAILHALPSLLLPIGLVTWMLTGFLRRPDDVSYSQTFGSH